MFNRIDYRLLGRNIEYVINSKQNRLHCRKSLHGAYRDCTDLHILLGLQNADICYFLFIEKIAQPTHSGTSHCPGMDLAGTRDISFHSGTVPGNPGHLVTLLCIGAAISLRKLTTRLKYPFELLCDLHVV